MSSTAQSIRERAARPADREAPIPGYTIGSVLGRGAMATVYHATQDSLSRAVALKVLVPGESLTAELSGRFLREGRLLAALNHRNVITIYDIGVHGGLYWLSMEHLPGGDLRTRLRDGVAPGKALAWVEAIAGALHAAHARGIVHRDVKPANILFRDDAVPVLTDFGVAKDLNQTVSETVDGTVVGSVAYLSPEQAEGRPLDCRCDIYGLGIIFYEMLVGQRPHDVPRTQAMRDPVGSLRALLAKKQEPLPRLPAKLAALQPILDRMTAVHPPDRYAGCDELVEAIARLRARSGAARRPVVPVPAAAPAGPPAPADNELMRRIHQDFTAGRIQVPAMPDVALRIRRAVEDPNAGVKAIGRIVQADPALAAYLVNIANSAVYRGAHEVQGARAAVTRMGMTATRDVVTSFVLRNVFKPGSKAVAERMRAIWQHSCVVGAVSAVLSRHARGIDPDQALLAGLVHDIGRSVVLAAAEGYPALAADRARLEATLDKLGPQVGAMVVRRWEFPPAFVTVVLESGHWERDAGPAVELCDIVLLAKLYSWHGKPKAAELPPLESVPAYAKFARGGAGDAFSLKVLQDARADLDALTRVLQG